MSLAAAVAKIEVAFPEIEAAVLTAPTSLAVLLQHISNIQCTAEEFERQAKRLSAEEARTLLTATLHRSMAYSTELLPLEQARDLASQLISAVGNDAQFFSNCFADDEVNGVGQWGFMVTSHTFESVLYCVGKHENALLVATDED
jgi:hypothetical protein